MKRKLKVTIYLMVVLMLFGLLGCNPSDADNQSSTTDKTDAKTEAKPTEQTEQTQTKEETQETINLEFWDCVWGPAEYTETVKELVNTFNNENDRNIEVSYQTVAWSNWYETFITAIAAQQAPDVSTGGGYLQHQVAEMGEILPLDSIVEEWKAEGKDADFYTGLLEYFRYKDIQAGIPWNVDSRVIFYRKDIFEEAGVELPKTWDEFLEVGKKVSNDEHAGLIFSLQDTASEHAMQLLMASNGCGFFDEQGNVAFDDEKHVETLDFIKSLVDEGVVPETVISTTQADAERMFLTGKSAMLLISVDFSEIMKSEMSADFVENVGVLSPIEGKSGGGFAPLNTNALMAYQQTKYPDEAKYFLKWWSENNLSLWTIGHCGPLPARKSFFEDEYFQSDRFKTIYGEEIISKAVTQTYPFPNATASMNTIEGQNYLRIAVQAALTTSKDSKTILSELAQDIQEIVDQSDVE